MTLTAGQCTTCQAETWISVRHPMTGERILLFPRPDSVYARCQRPTGIAPGIGFCAAHAPSRGDVVELGPVVYVDGAAERYRFWFSDRYGDFLRPWLVDELALPEHEADSVIAQWESARAEAGRG